MLQYIKDCNGRIFFTSEKILRRLNLAKFWIMNGTFKTAPTVFRQLYTIHANIGSESNVRIVPLVYSLMSAKSEELYRTLFQQSVDWQ